MSRYYFLAFAIGAIMLAGAAILYMGLKIMAAEQNRIASTLQRNTLLIQQVEVATLKKYLQSEE